MPRTKAENRLLFFAASRTIARTAGMSLYSTRRPTAYVRRFVEGRHVRRRRWRRRAEEHVQHPFAAQDRRRAVRNRRQRQNAALPEQAAAIRWRRHPLELVAGHVRNSIVLRKPLVDERVIRG